METPLLRAERSQELTNFRIFGGYQRGGEPGEPTVRTRTPGTARDDEKRRVYPVDVERSFGSQRCVVCSPSFGGVEGANEKIVLLKAGPGQQEQIAASIIDELWAQSHSLETLATLAGFQEEVYGLCGELGAN